MILNSVQISNFCIKELGIERNQILSLFFIKCGLLRVVLSQTVAKSALLPTSAPSAPLIQILFIQKQVRIKKDYVHILQVFYVKILKGF